MVRIEEDTLAKLDRMKALLPAATAEEDGTGPANDERRRLSGELAGEFAELLDTMIGAALLTVKVIEPDAGWHTLRRFRTYPMRPESAWIDGGHLYLTVQMPDMEPDPE